MTGSLRRAALLLLAMLAPAAVDAADATLFKISHTLKHRVTPITGTVRRTMYAGWFLDKPDFLALLKGRLAANSVEV